MAFSDARLHGAIDQSFHEGDLPDVGRQLQKSRDDVNAGYECSQRCFVSVSGASTSLAFLNVLPC